MKILITGASGFIGKHLVASLAQEHELFLIANSSSDLTLGKTYKIDLQNDEDVGDFAAKNAYLQFDVLINLASLVSKQNPKNNLDIVFKNTRMAKNVAELAIKFNCSKFINLSSTSVYPNIDGSFNEQSQIDPSQNSDALYGLSKFISEMIINNVLKGSSIITTHLRVSMVHGAGVDESRIWPVMENELRKTNAISVFGNGERLINQCSVDFVCNNIKKVLNGNSSGIYNVNQETISIFELAQRISADKGNDKSKINLIPSGNKFKFKVIAEKIKTI